MRIELLRAAVLGIVQGLTEFLPVSSSGHLEIAKFLVGDEAMGRESLMMTVLLHVATALSTIYVFRKDIWYILQGLAGRPVNEAQEFVLKVIISMVPAGLIGFFFEPVIERLFAQKLAFVGSMLFITALLLFFADRARTTTREVRYRDAFWIGCAQAVALLPGISRSGATVAASVILGVDRYRAARFSFLMVVPLILGKIGYEMLYGDAADGITSIPAAVIGGIAAFIAGVVACRWMITLVTRSRLRYFSIYCVAAGIFAILLAFYAQG